MATAKATLNASRGPGILIWPAIVACAVPAALIVLSATPVWLESLWLVWFPMPVGPILWAGSAVAALIIAVRAFRERSWRRALSALVLPLVVTGSLLNFFAFFALCREAGDRLHFLLARNSYRADIMRLPPAQGPRLVTWNWGGFVVSKGVVYDESDEIALPRQSPEWRSRAQGTELECGITGGMPLGGHFYLVGFAC